MRRIVRMCAGAGITAIVVYLSACSGGPAAPSIPADATGVIEGVWSGTLTILSQGQSYIGPAMVTFTTMPMTAAMSYRAHIQATTGYFALDNVGNAYTAWPGTPPTMFSLDQNYPAANGSCRGDFHASGQVETARHIDADVVGVEACASTYRGRLTLDRLR